MNTDRVYQEDEKKNTILFVSFYDPFFFINGLHFYYYYFSISLIILIPYSGRCPVNGLFVYRVCWVVIKRDFFLFFIVTEWTHDDDVIF